MSAPRPAPIIAISDIRAIDRAALILAREARETRAAVALVAARIATLKAREAEAKRARR